MSTRAPANSTYEKVACICKSDIYFRMFTITNLAFKEGEKYNLTRVITEKGLNMWCVMDNFDITKIYDYKSDSYIKEHFDIVEDIRDKKINSILE